MSKIFLPPLLTKSQIIILVIHRELFELLFVKVSLFAHKYIYCNCQFVYELFLCVLHIFSKKYCHFIVISHYFISSTIIWELEHNYKFFLINLHSIFSKKSFQYFISTTITSSCDIVYKTHFSFAKKAISI